MHQGASSEHEKEQIIQFLYDAAHTDPLSFAQTVDKVKPNEQESQELLDKLFIHWMNKAKKAAHENNREQYQKTEHSLQVIKKALLKPPMPGSSAIFWKNLFLQLKEQTN